MDGQREEEMEAENRRLVFSTASVLFLLSGFSGLVYEVIWFKRFSHVWGSSTMAMAAVVASFLFGLGLGAQVIGRWADRSRRPLFWYGVFECAIGVLAVLIPYEIPQLYRIASPLYPLLQNHVAAYYCVRFIFTFVVLGPPCILMGGTLPLLVKQFTPAGSSLKATTGWLYAINTMGAALGCYLAGFHLLPSFGLYWSNLMAVGVNLAVGVAALLITRYLMAPVAETVSPTPVLTEPEGAGEAGRGRPLRNLYAAVTITGFASLVLQMVWVRQLSVILGGSVYAFTAVLFVFLVGIGLGSLGFHLWLRKLSNLEHGPAFVIVGVVLATGVGYSLIPAVTFGIGAFAPLRTSQTANAVGCLGASGVLELVPALGMGLLFPLFVHLTRMRAENAGRAVGNVYAWNTLGCIVGASITSAVLIPTIGTSRTIAVALFLYLAAMVIQAPGKGLRNILVQTICACLGFVGIFLATRPQHALVTNFGMYMYGYQPPEGLLSAWKVLDFKEGPSCNVLVVEGNPGSHRSLRVNGKVDASTGDMPTQCGTAYFPRFLLPTARKVCIIGFGSGTTAGASLLFGETEVVCCEIEPAVFAASEHFHEVNHRPEESPNFTLVLDDGRNYLQGTSDKFDIIISVPSNPWIAGVSSLFTREYYETAKSRLTNKGILAQWIQLYSFSPAEYALVVRTIQSVFGHTALVRITDGDTLLLASAEPLRVEPETVRAAQELVEQSDAVKVKADLEKYFETTDVATLLLRHVILDGEGLSRLAAKYHGGLLNTDLNMRLEYDAPLRLFARRSFEKETVDALLGVVEVEQVRENFQRVGCSAKQIEGLYSLINLFAVKGFEETALELVDFGLEIEEDGPHLLAMKEILDTSGDSKRGERSEPRILASLAEEVSYLGVAFWRAKKYEQAASAFEELVVLHPQSAPSWANLGINYQALGREEKAEQAFERAMSLDPLNGLVRKSYEDFKAEGVSAGEGEAEEDRPEVYDTTSGLRLAP